ncbi:hypothetical protein GYB22_03685 [bacterium]|nr:hypothetical protein [bacterium]
MKLLKIYIFIALFLGSFQLSAQRITTGIQIGLNAFHQTEFQSNYLYSQNSYYIYYTGNSDKDDKPIYNQFFNGFHTGFNINVDYKRFMLTSEFTVMRNTIRTPVYFPTYLGGILEDDWSTYETINSSLNTALLLSVKFFSRANSPFLQFGAQYSVNRYNERQDNLDSEISNGISLFISENEMYGFLYTDDTKYWNAILALGLKNKDRYTSLRYSYRIPEAGAVMPSANLLKLELVHVRTLNFQRLRKGYKIYLEE